MELWQWALLIGGIANGLVILWAAAKYFLNPNYIGDDEYDY